MRVLVIANNFPTPDAPEDGIYVLRQLQALRALGHAFAVIRAFPFAPPVGNRWGRYAAVPAAYEIDAIPVRALRTFSLPRELLLETYGRQLAGRVRRASLDFGAELIHAQGLLSSGAIAQAAAMPYVLTGHGTDTYDMPWRRAGMTRAGRLAARAAVRTCAVSGFVAAHLRRLGAGEVRIVPNGADDGLFYPAERRSARERLGVPQERAIVAFAGRLQRWKGIVDLVEAAGQIRDLAPLVILAGDGPDRAAAERVARERGVELRVLGMVPQTSIAELFAASDVVALPSYREGLPTVLCEAMLAGRAVVASTAGGIPEVVRDGETGLLHEPGDTMALANAMRAILSDDVLRNRFEREAYARANDRLTWAANARAYDAVYREAAAESPLLHF